MHIGVAIEEPEEFVDYRFEVKFLGGEQREAVGKVETHLIAKHTFGSCACTVVFERAVGHYMIEQVDILFHKVLFSRKDNTKNRFFIVILHYNFEILRWTL